MSDLYSILIINRNGGLIYSKLLVQHNNINTNDLLRIASTLHGINAIAQYSIKINTSSNDNINTGNQQVLTSSTDNIHNNNTTTVINSKYRITPIYSNGSIHTIEYDNIRIQCYESVTGIKFILCCNSSISITICDKYLHSLYVLYCDYVLKNPFYDIDNPIRVNKFDVVVQQLVQT